MKNRLISFAYMLPIIELLFAAIIVLVPALLFFIRLKQMAHGSGSVSLGSGEIVLTIPSDRFLSVASIVLDGGAEKPVTILNTSRSVVQDSTEV